VEAKLEKAEATAPFAKATDECFIETATVGFCGGSLLHPVLTSKKTGVSAGCR
jgi:hypothetical protein